jgi:hypothetical protein
MIAATVPVEQLEIDPDLWPVDAVVYDRGRRDFLTREQSSPLARDGIGVARLHELVFRPLVEVVPDVLFEGYNIISAPPKIGKTVIMHQLMTAVHTGTDWLGRPVRQGPVLFFGLEDTLQSVQARDRRLTPEQVWPEFLSGGAGRVVVTDPGDAPVDRMLRLTAMVEAGHEGRPWALVVIDTSARFVGAGDSAQNAYERGLTLMAPLDRLGLRHHVAIVGVHHDRKGSDGDDFDAVSGGMSLTGTAQSVLSLRRSRGGELGTLNVYPRAAPERKIALEFVAGAWQLAKSVAVEVAEEAAGCRRAVMEYLVAHRDGAGLATLVREIRRYTYHNIRTALQRLSQAGKAVIEGTTWRAVADPAAVMSSASSAVSRPASVVVGSEHPGRCDRCGGWPARLHPKVGTVWCRACGPMLWDPQEPWGGTPVREEVDPPASDVIVPAVVPRARDGRAGAGGSTVSPHCMGPDGAPGEYARPGWAVAHWGHPITAWNTLLEESFRLKRTQLVAHPYAGEVDTPLPFRKPSQHRSAPIHGGSHTWGRASVEAGTRVTVIDRNAGYLGVLGTARLPIGRLKEVPGRGEEGTVGAHLLDHWPAWHRDDLPHPGGHRPRDGSPWVCTATWEVMRAQVGQGLDEFGVESSWVCRGLRLDKAQVELRLARERALAAGDEEMVAFVKAVYSLAIATSGESAANVRVWRPDWPPLIRAQFHANHWRAAARAVGHGLVVAAICNTDELHVVGDPFGSCVVRGCEMHPSGWVGTGFFTHGHGLKEWKSKEDSYVWGAR